jgi:hypothetical protein
MPRPLHILLQIHQQRNVRTLKKVLIFMFSTSLTSLYIQWLSTFRPNEPVMVKRYDAGC